MKKRSPLLFAFLAIMMALLVSCSQEVPKTSLSPEEAIAQVLDRTYGKYNEEFNARIVVANSYCVSAPDGGIDCDPFRDEHVRDTSDYYMNVARIDRIDSADYLAERSYDGAGHKYYVLLTGHGVPRCRACTGMFGAFVFEWQNGQWEVTSSAPHVLDGTSGEPATSWRPIRLDNADFWGWIAHHSGGSWHGHHYKWAKIHAPHKDKIIPVFKWTTTYNYAGTWYQNRPEGKQHPEETDLEMDIHLDYPPENANIYSLKATISGKVKGKKIKPKTFTIPFDEKEWKYKPPKEYEAYAKLMGG